jgi:hypothetical protein
MEFYFLNWVQLSCDFGKVVPSGTTQGYFCPACWNVPFCCSLESSVHAHFGNTSNHCVFHLNWLNSLYSNCKFLVFRVVFFTWLNFMDKFWFSFWTLTSYLLIITNSSRFFKVYCIIIISKLSLQMVIGVTQVLFHLLTFNTKVCESI